MLSISLQRTMLSWLGILWVVIRGAWSHNEAAMSSLPRQKLSACQPGTATPLSYNNLPTQWALSLDKRTGGAARRCGGRGEEWLRLGVRTGQGDDSAALSLSTFFWEWSRRAPLRNRAEVYASNSLNADCVTLYTAPPEFRGSGSFILWVLWMSGFVFRV